MHGFEMLLGHLVGDYIVQNDWMAANKTARSLPCFVHCVCYTLAVAALCWSWFPLWGYAVVFLAHFPIDRFRLAVWWMKNVSGQTAFATGPLSPWSFIIVDNVFHLLTLYAVAKLEGFAP